MIGDEFVANLTHPGPPFQPRHSGIPLESVQACESYFLLLCFFFGTRAPFLRASERPMAIACWRLLTLPPLPPRPDFKVPFFFLRMAPATDFWAPFPYLRPPDFVLGIQPPRKTVLLRTQFHCAVFALKISDLANACWTAAAQSSLPVASVLAGSEVCWWRTASLADP